jgi:hypothetical protein
MLAGQSPAELHPHVEPPLPIATHASPLAPAAKPAAQSAHAAPFSPQAVFVVPGSHVPPLEQQPPLHAVCCASPHAASHVPVAVLHD